ncbi:MAG: hypothetical protein ACHP6I_03760 [Rickettsiales bacterium]
MKSPKPATAPLNAHKIIFGEVNHDGTLKGQPNVEALKAALNGLKGKEKEAFLLQEDDLTYSTVLEAAIKYGSLEVVKIILDQTDIDFSKVIPNKNDRIPLYNTQNTEQINILLDDKLAKATPVKAAVNGVLDAIKPDPEGIFKRMKNLFTACIIKPVKEILAKVTFGKKNALFEMEGGALNKQDLTGIREDRKGTQDQERRR